MSTASEKLQLILEAQVRGSDELKRLAENMERFTASSKKASDQATATGAAAEKSVSGFQRFADGVGSFIKNPLDAAGNSATNFLKTIGPMGSAVVGIVAGVGTAASQFKEMAIALGDAAEAQVNMGIRTGLSVKEVGQFTIAAEMAGVGAGGFETAMKTLSQVLSDNTEDGKRGKQALKDLGVTVYDSSGQARSAGALWRDLSNAIGGIQDPYARATAAQKIFGKSAIELLPLLGELSGSVERFKRLGFGMDEAKAKDLDGIADRLKEIDLVLGKIAKNARVSIVLGLKPQIEWLDKAAGNFLMMQNAGAKGPQDPMSQLLRLVMTPGLAMSAATMGVDLAAGEDYGGYERGASMPRNLTPSQRAARLSLQGSLSSSNTSRGGLESRLQQVKKELEDAQGLGQQYIRDRVSDEGKLTAQAEKVAKLTAEYAGLEEQLKAVAKAGEAQRLVMGFTDSLQKVSADPIEKLNVEYAKLIRQLKEARAGSDIFASAESAYRSQLLSMLPTSEVTFKNRRKQLEYLNPNVYMVPTDALNQANSAFNAASSGEAYGAGVIARTNLDRQRELEILRQSYDYQARKVELIAGPGGEVGAIRTVAQIRLALLEEEERRGADGFDLQRRRNQVLMDQELAILGYKKQQESASKQQGMQIFDAITAGGGGLQNYVKGLALGQGRTVFGNAYQIATTGLEGKLSLTNDPNSLLGKLLSGTPFGVDPMKQAADTQLKAATIMMGAATTIAGGRGGVGGSAISQAISLMSGGGSASGTVSLPPYMVESNSVRGPAFDTSEEWMTYGANLPYKAPTSLASKVGSYAALAGAGYGIYSGAQQGGARGALTAAASTAGIVAMLPSLMPAIGKALPLLGPIGAIAGIGLGLVGMFLPDPKQKRAKELESEAASRRFTEPTGTDYVTDLYGRKVDYNKSGELRPIIVQVSAMDAKSFIDRQEDIGEAVRQAIDSYPPLTNSMRSAVLALG
jgi:hypothetical protein